MYFRKIRLVVRSKELVLVISYRLSFVSLFIPGLKLQVSTRFLGLKQYKDILSFVCVIRPMNYAKANLRGFFCRNGGGHTVSTPHGAMCVCAGCEHTILHLIFQQITPTA